MLITKVKICGITNYDDAAAASDMGADLLGFNFYARSPRFVTPQIAAEIINRLPGFVDVAGVFVNASFERIKETLDACQLNWIQFHGNETPDSCQSFLSFNVNIKSLLERHSFIRV